MLYRLLDNILIRDKITRFQVFPKNLLLKHSFLYYSLLSIS